MGRLPLFPTGNHDVDSMMRLIDEQLSELYSLHGQLSSRGNMNQQTSTSYEGDGTNPVLIDQQNTGVVIGSKFLQQESNTPTIADIKTPARRALYPDQLIWAYALTSGVSGIIRGFGITVSNPSAGIYNYTFKNPMDTIQYCIFASPLTQPIVDGGGVITEVFGVITATNLPYVATATTAHTASGFQVKTYDPNIVPNTWTLQPLTHQVFVLGVPA